MITRSIIAILTLFMACSVNADNPQGVSINTILDTTNSWNGKTLPNNVRNTVTEIVVQPGITSGIHKHPLNGVGYVLEGELTMFVTENENGDFSDPSKVSKIIVHAGETWSGAVNTWTYAQNNGDKPAKFTVTYIGDADLPTSIPLK